MIETRQTRIPTGIKSVAAKGVEAVYKDGKPNWNAPDQIQLILASNINPNPFNPRKHTSQVEMNNLKKSIETDGIRVPIKLCRATGDHDKALLLSGHRRFFVVGLLHKDLTTILLPATMHPEKLTEVEMRKELLVLNEGQVKPALVDRVQAIYEYMNLAQIGISDTAKQLGIDQGVLGKQLKILELPQDVLQQINEGQIKETTALILPHFVGHSKQREIAEKIVAERLTAEKVKAILEKSNKPSLPSGKNTDPIPNPTNNDSTITLTPTPDVKAPPTTSATSTDKKSRLPTGKLGLVKPTPSLNTNLTYTIGDVTINVTSPRELKAQDVLTALAGAISQAGNHTQPIAPAQTNKEDTAPAKPEIREQPPKSPPTQEAIVKAAPIAPNRDAQIPLKAIYPQDHPLLEKAAERFLRDHLVKAQDGLKVREEIKAVLGVTLDQNDLKKYDLTRSIDAQRTVAKWHNLPNGSKITVLQLAVYWQAAHERLQKFTLGNVSTDNLTRMDLFTHRQTPVAKVTLLQDLFTSFGALRNAIDNHLLPAVRLSWESGKSLEDSLKNSKLSKATLSLQALSERGVNLPTETESYLFRWLKENGVHTPISQKGVAVSPVELKSFLEAARQTAELNARHNAIGSEQIKELKIPFIVPQHFKNSPRIRVTTVTSQLQNNIDALSIVIEELSQGK